MSLERVRSRRGADGKIVVTLEFTTAAWRAIQHAARDGGYFSGGDYLAGELGRLLLELGVEDAPAVRDGAAEDTMPDDGIPF